MQATMQLAPYTRHLHLSTVTPPFNGVDSHEGFLAKDYAQGALPSLEQVANWLRLFKDEKVWVIPEPFGNADVHLRNHRVLHPVISRLAEKTARE